ncbi:MAG: ferric reductase [Rhodobacteraceae bacterium]|nr:ferric reductase [Paracoccaceae bacterium]
MPGSRATLIWVLVGAAILVPSVWALTSPLLQWRDPVYIVAGFAGVIGMALLLVQPLLVGGYLPGLAGMRGRGLHRIVGALLVLAVVVHVVGLWITSPPDVVDALLLVSPTPFATWGVIAMWAMFAAASLGVLRRRFAVRLRLWRVLHTASVCVVVIGTVVHAVQIEGTMEIVSKWMLSVLALLALACVIVDRRVWSALFLSRSK